MKHEAHNTIHKAQITDHGSQNAARMIHGPCSMIRGSRGFTLIEMMVAVGIFTIIMVIGIGALLSITNSAHKSETQQTINDNLNFLLEDMARNIRLGSSYYCLDTSLAVGTHDCAGGNSALGVAFEGYKGTPPSADGTSPNLGDQIMYSIYLPDDLDETHGAIEKSTDGGTSWSDLTPHGTGFESVYIDRTRSGFTVVGSTPGSTGDALQPYVLIHLAGTVKYQNLISPFNVETTVTQRQLDQ